MRLLFDQTINITAADNKTNIDLPLEITEDNFALFIQTAYTPKVIEDRDLARREIEAGIVRYIPENDRAEFGRWEDYLPLVNFITLSVDCGDEYIGCAHRHSPVQDHIISPAYSSPGFIRHAVRAGRWNFVLNCHAVVNGTVQYRLRIWGADENEELHDHIQAF